MASPLERFIDDDIADEPALLHFLSLILPAARIGSSTFSSEVIPAPPIRATPAPSDESRSDRSFPRSATCSRLKTEVEYVAATILSASAVGASPSMEKQKTPSTPESCPARLIKFGSWRRPLIDALAKTLEGTRR
jgi:hypothetical protein